MEAKHFWMVRAGFRNALGSQIEQKNAIAVGWNAVGDLSQLESNEAFLERYRQMYPNDEENRVKVMVRQLYTFAQEIAIGDYVLTYVKPSKKYLFGQVKSAYFYDPTVFSEQYPHVRKVKWEKQFFRSDLTPSALGSIGSILSVFKLHKHLEEILALKI